MRLHEYFKRVTVTGNSYDPIAGISTTLKDNDTQVEVSPVASWENAIDLSEVVLRYIFWKHDKDNWGSIDLHASPYDYPEFKEVLLLANIWKDLHALWANVKFHGWTPRKINGGTVYLPSDLADLKRRFVSIVRSNRFEAQELPHVVDHLETSDSDWIIGKIARKGKLPNPGKKWDCCLDIKYLRQAIQDTSTTRTVQFYIDFKNYKPLADRLNKDSENGNVKWDEWLSVRNTLCVLGKVARRMLKNQVHNPDEKTERGVILIDLNELANLISKASDLNYSRCYECLSLMILKHGKTSFTIFDQPLLPVNNSTIVLVPGLVMYGNLMYGMEHLTELYEGENFSCRGIPFEKNIAEKLSSHGLAAKADLWLVDDSGRTMNYDAVVWWQNCIILIEAKCVKTELAEADDFNTKMAVEKSIEQLEIRKNELPNFWHDLRQKVPEFHLPEIPLEKDRIYCISVTNSIRYCGLCVRDVICTDDNCLLHYFDSPISKVYSVGMHESRVVGSFRNREDEISPKGLLDYLKNPPQIQSLTNDVKITYRGIVQIDNEQEPIAVPHYSYHGTIEKSVKNMNGNMFDKI